MEKGGKTMAMSRASRNSLYLLSRSLLFVGFLGLLVGVLALSGDAALKEAVFIARAGAWAVGIGTLIEFMRPKNPTRNIDERAR
jgi:hypothetical protein